jgi:hypothetical protein
MGASYWTRPFYRARLLEVGRGLHRSSASERMRSEAGNLGPHLHADRCHDHDEHCADRRVPQPTGIPSGVCTGLLRSLRSYWTFVVKDHRAGLDVGTPWLSVDRPREDRPRDGSQPSMRDPLRIPRPGWVMCQGRPDRLSRRARNENQSCSGRKGDQVRDDGPDGGSAFHQPSTIHGRFMHTLTQHHDEQ